MKIKKPFLLWILNKASIACAVLAVALSIFGEHDAAGFLLLFAIYTDGRLFLYK